VVTRLGGIVLPADDAVHGALGSYNILVDNDSIAIIDLGACGPGTRALDYAWLLRQAHHDPAPDHVVDRIRTAGQQVAGEEAFTVCLLAAVLEMVASAADHGHTEAAVQEVHRARLLLVN